MAVALWIGLSAMALPLKSHAAEGGIFPVHDCISANVSFWIDIYSKYSSRQGVLHDKYNLAIVYEVIALRDPDLAGSRPANRRRIRAAKEKYRAILAKLARGEKASTAEERRVAGLFGTGAGDSDFQKAQHHLRCQLGQKDRFREGIIRSGAWLEEIRRIFHAHGLPEDLAYLPHVESSFNPKAYSKFGAAGIWQFTRRTGRRFMRVDAAVDERRDAILSSHAAALLLKGNYRSLRDWPLAVTAYNHGTGGMLRARRLMGGYEAIVTRYRSRRFRFASRNFYAEFLAAREVARNCRRYFGALQLERPAETRSVTLKGYAALEDLARHFGLKTTALQRLNPALRGPVLRGNRDVPPGYRLRLPLAAERETLAAGIPSELYRRRSEDGPVYIVRRGDTAGKIARDHGVALQELIAANQLDPRATIHVRQQLRIPRPSRGHKLSTPSPASGRQLEDSAKEFKIDPFRPADLLWLEHPAMTAEKFAPRNLAGDTPPKVGTLRVEAEETLGHYAEWLEVTAGRIRRLNGFGYGRPLRLGEAIKVPLERVSAEAFARRRTEYHRQLAEDFFAVYRIEKMITYAVRRGDNIWALARDRFEVPLWLLRHCNEGLDFAALAAGTPLNIPVLRENS
jgi:membrane-bound lytic murein transglycosylase D